MLPRAASDHFIAQTRLSTATTLAARRLWATMPTEFDQGWQRIGPQLFALVSAGQIRAAADGAAYIGAVAEEVGIDPTESGSVRPRAFGGVASDGRALDTLLYQPVISAKAAIGAGSTVDAALASGGHVLELIVSTQIADASRSAQLASMTSRRAISGYTRVLAPPSCSRCVILAGKHFKWQNDFDRHPKCDCYCIPSSEAAGYRAEVVNPESYFYSLSKAEQDRVFGKREAEAIRLGASPITVVNSNRGIFTPSGRRFPTPSKRTPVGALLIQSDGDRDKAIELLRKEGFITESSLEVQRNVLRRTPT